MINNTFQIFSTFVDTYLYVQKKFGTHSRALAPGGTGTSSRTCALISAASSLLFATLLILLTRTVLYFAVHYATNWHGRFFRPFLTVLSPNSVDRKCPGRDSGSSSTRQSGPTSSHASIQPSSALPPAGGRARNIGGKRPGDDGSDAEDNDRNKRRRLKAPDESKARVRCPFKDRDPDNPEFEQCGSFDDWSRLREHLLVRKHRPLERCPKCGEIFDDDVNWTEHAGACQPSSQQLGRPSWVDKKQATLIRALSSNGRKTEGSLEEMHRKVCKILFGDEIAPARAASGHPTFYPHVQPTDDFEQDVRPQERWNPLTLRIRNLPGMQDVPHATILQIIHVCHYLGNNEASIAGRGVPPVAPSQGQIPLIPEPQYYAAERSDGSYVYQGAIGSSPVPDLGAHAVFPQPPLTAFTPGSGTTQVSDAAFLGPLQAQSLDDTDYFTTNDEILGSLGIFDLGDPEFYSDMYPMQQAFGAEPPDEDEDRDSLGHLPT